MLGDIGNGQAQLGCKRVDAALPLSQMFDQFEPLRIAQGFRHGGELLIERQFWIAD
jgi:hypothetical protein